MNKTMRYNICIRCGYKKESTVNDSFDYVRDYTCHKCTSTMEQLAVMYSKQEKENSSLDVVDRVLRRSSDTPLEQRRQEGKKPMGPSILMEIFGHQLKLGSEKGYTEGSWQRYLIDNSDVMPSIKRHLIGVEQGVDDGWYTEYRPDGTPCDTKANHAYALFWNAAIEAIRVYNRANNTDPKDPD